MFGVLKSPPFATASVDLIPSSTTRTVSLVIPPIHSAKHVLLSISAHNVYLVLLLPSLEYALVLLVLSPTEKK